MSQINLVHIYKVNEEKRHDLGYPYGCFCEPEVRRVVQKEDVRIVIHQSYDEMKIHKNIMSVKGVSSGNKRS